MSEPANALSVADSRALARIERLAREMLKQTGHLRRNGRGDRIRFMLLESDSDKLHRTAVAAERRWLDDRYVGKDGHVTCE